ncbi:MAG TPA: hypothetical protein VFI23_10745 [Rhizomicrobium sp.]|nr:hypothetical protein [Rhizomicrobium sp.]
MKKILIAFAIPLALAVTAPAHAATTCINIRDIDSSQSKDGRTMVFKMKDGTVLVNHLQGFCPDLKYTGFAWHLPGSDINACERQTSFQVLQSMQNCTLGKFDPPTRSVDTNRRPAPPAAPDLDEHAR